MRIFMASPVARLTSMSALPLAVTAISCPNSRIGAHRLRIAIGKVDAVIERQYQIAPGRHAVGGEVAVLLVQRHNRLRQVA